MPFAYCGDQLKNEICGIRGTYERDVHIQRFGQEKREECWKIILKSIFKEWDGKAWIVFVWHRRGDSWWTLVNAVMKLWVLQNAGEFLNS